MIYDDISYKKKHYDGFELMNHNKISMHAIYSIFILYIILIQILN